MDDFVEAPPTTALDSPSPPPRPNQLFQGVLSFLAVVGIGAAVTLALHPPLKLRVITVERRLPPPVAAVAPPPPAPRPPIYEPPRIKHPRPQVVAKLPPQPLRKSDDCKDPLCGLGDLKQ